MVGNNGQHFPANGEVAGQLRAALLEVKADIDGLNRRVGKMLALLEAFEATPSIRPELLTPEQAATVLGISRSKVFELIGDGTLRSGKIGGSRRVPRRAIEELVRRLETDNRTDEDPGHDHTG